MDILYNIHQRIGTNIKGGGMFEEFEEQLMLCEISKYFKENDRFLELGTNIGRALLVLAHLTNPENIVSVDMNPEYINICKRNLERNYVRGVKLIPKAISNVPLVRNGWNVFPMDENTLDSMDAVETITWSDFKKNYGTFTVIVADCEGAMFHILKENPDFLDGIRIIIIENDYKTTEETRWVDSMFFSKGYRLIYDKPSCNGFLNIISPHYCSAWMYEKLN